jgi:hypothetical protein
VRAGWTRNAADLSGGGLTRRGGVSGGGLATKSTILAKQTEGLRPRLCLAGIRPSKRIPLEQIQFCSPGEGKRKTTADVIEGFASNPPTRKLSVWSQVYRLARLRSSASHPTRLSRIGSTSTPRNSDFKYLHSETGKGITIKIRKKVNRLYYPYTLFASRLTSPVNSGATHSALQYFS